MNHPPPRLNDQGFPTQRLKRPRVHMSGAELRRRGLAWPGDGVRPPITRQQLRQLARKHPECTYQDFREAARKDGMLPESNPKRPRTQSRRLTA